MDGVIRYTLMTNNKKDSSVLASNKNNYAHTANAIKIATINLFNYVEPPFAFYDYDAIYDAEKWQRKSELLENYINQHQPDVVAFQEVFSVGCLKNQMKSLGYPSFAVVDEPHIEDGYIMSEPVVCLASKHPIVDQSGLKANQKISNALGLSDDFQYSRTPLKVMLDLPLMGEVAFYVVHLKSKRVVIDNQSSDLYDILNAEITGRSFTELQRLTESTQIMAQMVTERAHSQYPMILLGDFNDDLNASALRPFHMNHTIQRIQKITDFPLSHFQLFNAWDIFSNQTVIGSKPFSYQPAPPTHFYHQSGDTLDHILVSSEFNQDLNQDIYEISDFICEDNHLSEVDERGDLLFTDHAIIQITITAKN